MAWAAVGATLVVAAACGTSAPPVATTSTSVTAAPASAPASVPTGQPVAGPNSGAPEINPVGDIPDNQVFVPFTSSDGTVVVSVPEGWARSADGAATVFTDKFNSVRVEVAPQIGAVDVAGARATDVPRLQAAVPGFALRDVSTVRRKAGTAVLISYEADSAVNPVTGRSVREAVERYTFTLGGTQAVLTLTGPKGADNVDPWRIVTNSLQWQP